MRTMSKHIAIWLVALALAVGGLAFLAPQHALAGSASNPLR